MEDKIEINEATLNTNDGEFSAFYVNGVGLSMVLKSGKNHIPKLEMRRKLTKEQAIVFANWILKVSE
jgi:hypothetical protein